MKVLLTTTAYPPSMGGAQLYTHHLARNLLKQGRVQVVCHWDANRSDWIWGTTVQAPNESKDYTIDEVAVHRMGWPLSQRLLKLPAAAIYIPSQKWAIDHLAADIRYQLNAVVPNSDIVHNVRVGREPISYASFGAARQRGVPFVLTPLHHPRWNSWFHRHYIALYHQADALIALTHFERDMLMQLGIPGEKISVTGTGPVVDDDPNPDAFRTAHNLEGPMVLFLGQKFRYKNYDALLRAAPLVWETHPHVHFVFVGPRSKHSRRTFQSVKDKRIIEMDRVSSSEKSNALMACDILCMPSSQESFGSVYLEAWMYGKPVIGGNAPAIRHVIDHDVDGLITDPYPEQIAQYIRQLLDDKARAQELGAAGKQKVLDHYTWENITSKTLAAYHYAESHLTR